MQLPGFGGGDFLRKITSFGKDPFGIINDESITDPLGFDKKIFGPTEKEKKRDAKGKLNTPPTNTTLLTGT